MKGKQTPGQGETWPSQGTGELRKMASLGKDVGIVSGSMGVYGLSINKNGLTVTYQVYLIQSTS